MLNAARADSPPTTPPYILHRSFRVVQYVIPHVLLALLRVRRFTFGVGAPGVDDRSSLRAPYFSNTFKTERGTRNRSTSTGSWRDVEKRIVLLQKN